MQPQGPAFWLLDGRTGWCTARADRVSVSPTGVSLAADPVGPLALTSEDGSLGGLTLPRGLALDDTGLLYLLSPAAACVKRFDPATRCFQTLPGLGGEGQEARQFHQPAAIAIAGANLYLADRGNRRVSVFDLGSLVLRHLWGARDDRGRPVTADDPAAWDPADVAAHADAGYILDRRHGRVYRHRVGTDELSLVIALKAASDRWSRLALDREGRIYLLDAAVPRLEIYSADGHPAGEAGLAGDVRDRFAAPPLRLDHQGRFCLPAGLQQPCARRAEPLPPEIPLFPCFPSEAAGLVFDRQGNRAVVEPAEWPGPPPYATQGAWFSKALDSGLYRCQWHRIELELAALPAGSQVVVSTFAEAAAGLDPPAFGSSLWETRFAIAGPLQPPSASAPSASTHEFLIQSRAGQYLRLQVELGGDGYATPVVSALRVHYPRQSYLDYLPAVYAADEDSRWFLERFLAIFQTEWDELERRLEDIPAYFDVKAVPAKFLGWLAGWFGLPLEDTWNTEQQRRLLMALPGLQARRGTPAALRAFLCVYLANITGLTVEEITALGLPRLVEGFNERRHLLLAMPDSAVLRYGAPLWSPARVGRLQLDVFAREGEIRLVSTGDPERDLFHEYAHRFRVFVPAAWVRTAKAERMVRRALDMEKPAHTRYDLCLVEPRWRVGLQSTLGFDTIIGDYPVARLACGHETDTPPSRAPRHCLGYDTVLGTRPGRSPGLCLTPGTRLGMETVLT